MEHRKYPKVLKKYRIKQEVNAIYHHALDDIIIQECKNKVNYKN